MNEISAPNVLPVAADTWSAKILLPRTEQRSGRVSVSCPVSLVLVGIHSVVIPASSVGGGLLVPGLDDIALALDVNEDRRFTSQRKDNTSAQASSAFVSLSAMQLRERFLKIDVGHEGTAPDIGFELEWHRFTQGTPIYEDALVIINMFVDRSGK
jgi:hypothetical protein